MNSAGVAMVVVGYRPLLRPKCFASNPKINTEQLRYQLDQLHAEAETTRAKAGNARLRFLRLSEAAEKLRRQAAVSIQRGKENEARDLLFQKKKIMQALEKSKSRIELLDKLSTKLSEVINVKETQLIGNIASDSEIGEENDSSPVRVVSPKEQAEKDKNNSNDFGVDDALPASKDQNLLLHTNDLVEQPANEELEEHQAFASNGDNKNGILAAISTYEDFLEHLDQQLKKIEQELITILNVSTLLLDDEKPKNVKVQQTTELLESILDIRQRITNIRQTKVEIS